MIELFKDPHVANFYSQCEKLSFTSQISHQKNAPQSHTFPINNCYNPAKRRAPIALNQNEHKEVKENIPANIISRDVVRNSFKVIIPF
jgi:hypothetical protein